MEVQPYNVQLNLLKKMILEKGEGPPPERVAKELGTDICALHSVPTAIFCFLRAQRPINGIQTENPLRRTIQYAVSIDFRCTRKNCYNLTSNDSASPSSMLFIFNSR